MMAEDKVDLFYNPLKTEGRYIICYMIPSYLSDFLEGPCLAAELNGNLIVMK